MALPTKQCATCHKVLPVGPREQGGCFHRNFAAADGYQAACVPCKQSAQRRNRHARAESRRRAESATPPHVHVPAEDDGFEIVEGEPIEDQRAAQVEAERTRREASDFEALKPGDFEAGIGRGAHDPSADREKKQEYARQMGELAGMLADPATVSPEKQDQLGAYVARLAEEERRFGNRRLARSVSLGVAREALFLRQFKQACSEHLTGKIEPADRSAATPPEKPSRRSVNILLSDLHFGSDLAAAENPTPFGATEEARRFGKIIAEVADYKPQYRAGTTLNVLLNGDLFEGDLGHDQRSGAPLTEQFVATMKYLGKAIASWAAVYPRVHVECQAGNHGRRKERHWGRATHQRWDSHEHNLFWSLEAMASRLSNVTFSIPFRAVSILDLHGANLLMAHGDGEPKMAHPDKGARENAATMERVNATRQYGVEVQLATFGHYHTPRNQPLDACRLVFNGALVPPNGNARASGWTGEKCGQWLWESVEGYPLGDMRFLEVGASEDRDATLEAFCAPFRFAA